MRLRMVDAVTAYKPWQSIHGRKVVSLEEYHLLEKTGRKGVLPESLLIESAVELGRWLIMVSSDLTLEATLDALLNFQITREIQCRDVVEISLTLLEKNDEHIAMQCKMRVHGEMAAHGKIHWKPCALASLHPVETCRLLWEKLHVPTR